MQSRADRAAPTAPARRASASASIPGVGRTETQDAGGDENGVRVTGTATDLYPDDAHAGEGQITDMKAAAKDGEVTSHTEEAAFMPRCPDKDGRSSGQVTTNARQVARTGDAVVQVVLHMSGTVTEQFDGEGHYQSTSVDVNFSSLKTVRSPGESFDKEVDGSIDERIDADGKVDGQVGASVHGGASEAEAQAAVKDFVKQLFKATSVARSGVRKAVEGGALTLTYSGQGSFDLEDEGGGGESRAHDDLTWTAEYELRRDGERLEPDGPGTLSAGPGNFSFRWPEYMVDCTGQLADGPQLPEITPAGYTDTEQRFELKPIHSLLDGEDLSNYLACQGEISNLPYDGSGVAADQTAGALNPSLPYVLEIDVRIPTAAAKAGAFSSHVTEADGQAKLPSSCDELFGTLPGECTMSLHYTGTVTLAPRSCVASGDARSRPDIDRRAARARRPRGGAGER